MTAEDLRQLQKDALLELHEAIADERAHEVKLDNLIGPLREIASAHEAHELRAYQGDLQHGVSLGSGQAVHLPERRELYDASLEMETASRRVGKAKQRCRDLGLPESLG